ncbi:MAG: SHOCT domain-containing protein [Gammaproteobacteria bacterium]
MYAHWTNWYSGWGWGWFLWFGVMIVLFSRVGNWGYIYRIPRTYGRQPRKEALDILSERYARGEITQAEFGQMKTEIAATVNAR